MVMVAGKKVKFLGTKSGYQKAIGFLYHQNGPPQSGLGWAYDWLMLLKLDVCKCALLKEAARDRFHEW